jgi:hypothetical protein
MDNLYSQGTISTEVLGVHFADETGSATNDANGVLTLGGTDSSYYSGSITYTNRVGDYWGVAVTKVAYGGSSLGSITQAIVDTGTTLVSMTVNQLSLSKRFLFTSQQIYLPTSIYDKFVDDSDGAYDDETGLVRYSSKPTGDLVLTIGGTEFTLTPDDYLLPQEQYENWGIVSTSSHYYTYVGDGGDETPDAILGMFFLTNFYSVFDTYVIILLNLKIYRQ